MSNVSNNFVSNARLDLCSLSVTYDIKEFARELNVDLKKINEWDFQLKINLNPQSFS